MWNARQLYSCEKEFYFYLQENLIMNQKTKYTLRTCLGAAFAALLINPLASYAGTWSNQGGPNQWKYDLGDGSYAADGWYWIDSD